MISPSLPEVVMRTGIIAPFGPTQIRQQVKPANINRMTALPTGIPSAPNPPSTTTDLPPATSPEDSPTLSGFLMGADADGRPMRVFPVGGNPTTDEGRSVVAALKRVANEIRKNIPGAASPALVGGPLSSLVRGEAVTLRWPNGVAIIAAL